MKKRLTAVALLVAAGLQGAPALAEIKVFACEPEWGAVTRALAGEHADIYVATTAQQDPHYIQARPSLIAEIRDAELLVCSGAQLEVGWLPLLLRRSGNRGIQTGEPGHFLAALQVRRLEIPSRIDRSQGDIHPEGNPHVHLDPHNILRIAAELTERLGSLDPANRATYRQAHASFESDWRKAIALWEEQARPLNGLVVITQHKSFSYLADWLGLVVAENIEPKPGIPPSGAHLSRLLDAFRDNPPAAVLRTPYEDPKPSDWLGERLGIPVITLPYTTSMPGEAALFELFDATIGALLEIAP